VIRPGSESVRAHADGAVRRVHRSCSFGSYFPQFAFSIYQGGFIDAI
jgi:hypothetical protein